MYGRKCRKIFPVLSGLLVLIIGITGEPLPPGKLKVERINKHELRKPVKEVIE